jgi:hypothetical protein
LANDASMLSDLAIIVGGSSRTVRRPLTSQQRGTSRHPPNKRLLQTKLPTYVPTSSQRSIAVDEMPALLRGVIGLPLSHAWRGHGSALFLELGALRNQGRSRLPRGHPRNPRGEAGVMIEWSWRIERRRSIQAGSWSSERRIDAAVRGLVGPSLTEIAVTGRLPELSLTLSDGRCVPRPALALKAESEPLLACRVSLTGYVSRSFLANRLGE